MAPQRSGASSLLPSDINRCTSAFPCMRDDIFLLIFHILRSTESDPTAPLRGGGGGGRGVIKGAGSTLVNINKHHFWCKSFCFETKNTALKRFFDFFLRFEVGIPLRCYKVFTFKRNSAPSLSGFVLSLKLMRAQSRTHKEQSWAVGGYLYLSVFCCSSSKGDSRNTFCRREAACLQEEENISVVMVRLFNKSCTHTLLKVKYRS